MGRIVKIMVACGSGVATSMHVASIIKEYLDLEKLSVSIDGTSVNSLQTRISGVDLIVSTAQVPFSTEGIEVINAVPILTGIGREEVLAQIAKKVRELSEKTFK